MIWDVLAIYQLIHGLDALLKDKFVSGTFWRIRPDHHGVAKKSIMAS
jgi:hypothetical protein